MMEFSEIIIAVTTLLAALMAGFFFAYTFSVNLGLGKLNDRSYLQAMQNINRRVLNPVFFFCFLGPLLLLPVTTIQQYGNGNLKFICSLIATIAYLIGVFTITGIKNVPLNEKLDAFQINTATDQSILQMREVFEKPWNFWNNIRTIFAIISLLALIITCISIER